MEKYKQLKNRQEKEMSLFPIAFAFNDEQLKEGLAKLGVTAKECTGVTGGGFIRRTDKRALVELLARHDRELDSAMKSEEFATEAIKYELGNHEYCVTGDPEDALRSLGISDLSDPHIIKCFRSARDTYNEEMAEMGW